MGKNLVTGGGVMQLSNDTSKNSTSPPYLVKIEQSLTQKDCNVPIEWFFACFWHFLFLTQTEHFAKAIARWPILKVVSFLECLVFFRAVFCTEQL